MELINNAINNESSPQRKGVVEGPQRSLQQVPNGLYKSSNGLYNSFNSTGRVQSSTVSTSPQRKKVVEEHQPSTRPPGVSQVKPPVCEQQAGSGRPLKPAPAGVPIRSFKSFAATDLQAWLAPAELHRFQQEAQRGPDIAAETESRPPAETDESRRMEVERPMVHNSTTTAIVASKSTTSPDIAGQKKGRDKKGATTVGTTSIGARHSTLPPQDVRDHKNTSKGKVDHYRTVVSGNGPTNAGFYQPRQCEDEQEIRRKGEYSLTARVGHHSTARVAEGRIQSVWDTIPTPGINQPTDHSVLSDRQRFNQHSITSPAGDTTVWSLAREWCAGPAAARGRGGQQERGKKVKKYAIVLHNLDKRTDAEEWVREKCEGYGCSVLAINMKANMCRVVFSTHEEESRALNGFNNDFAERTSRVTAQRWRRQETPTSTLPGGGDRRNLQDLVCFFSKWLSSARTGLLKSDLHACRSPHLPHYLSRHVHKTHLLKHILFTSSTYLLSTYNYCAEEKPLCSCAKVA